MLSLLEGIGKTSTWLRAVLEPNRTLLVIDMQVFGWGIGDMIYLDDMKISKKKDYVNA